MTMQFKLSDIRVEPGKKKGKFFCPDGTPCWVRVESNGNLHVVTQNPSLSSKPSKGKKKISKEEEDEKEKISKTNKLAKKYATMKKEHYKRKVPVARNGSKAWNHFYKAVDIMKEHGVTIKTYMKAQIYGLGWVDDGVGIFPRESHLSGGEAENRLLEYLRIKKLKSVELTEEEKETELQSNKKYKQKYKKVEKETANLMEALYVKTCQIERTGKAQGFVLDYIKELKKKV